MSTNSTKNVDNQELDLSAVSKGIGNMFRNLNTFLYGCIRFVIRNIILFGILLIIGIGLGTWMDYTQKKVYNHQIVVSPNFGSVDYLYLKVNMIEAKIKEKDTVFLKNIGIQDPGNLIEIRISPIIDVFKFVTRSEQNYKLLELMAQDGDIKKVTVENTTSKNYPYHTITFITRGKTNEIKTVSPILAYLNNSPFYSRIQKEYINNVKLKIQQNEQTIAQINAVLNEFSHTTESGAKNANLVYYNENTQLNDVIETKDELVKEQGTHRIDLVGIDKIIKDSSIVLNVKDEDTLTGKMKVMLPILLFVMFLLVYFFRAFYRKQTLKHSAQN